MGECIVWNKNIHINNKSLYIFNNKQDAYKCSYLNLCLHYKTQVVCKC